MPMNWPVQPTVWVHTRAICMKCEAYYWAVHPLGRAIFFCPHCLLQTGQALHG